ncbi:MAG: ATP-dependent 6-phosphofructokinase [Desulfobacterales bacterium]|jgi:6-phosphofructokinase 1|nr:ATP-dependent 6-phosphofructokinase [Desulfobacteraceae bacterium]MBT4364240.1 ATP-dependent 6-phosphofructokinase [Desulfobacteraceae bacterium]MBT7085415.1 ATP-dependent 6-phosphofructokinase [Desulfobacterales bacterium]MBT7695809.1 ATP-dependent 6-phosphofructokinase [Desulfobacterales bacterium]
MIDTSIDTTVLTLGEAKITSPIQTREIDKHHFISDDDKVLIYIKSKIIKEFNEEKVPIPAFELAGPRSKIYFDPSKVRCAIATCGGLCPGLNDIIRSIVLELYHGYGVRNIYGIKYGLQGFIPKYGHDVVDMTPDMVVNILDMGGTILGSSRGPQEIEEIIDSLERMNIGILFMIGGDGTLMAATKIAGAIDERGLKTSIIGIPKTIDNDIYFIAKSFGFDTAVEVATSAIKGAHNEAEGYPNGIGLIKLMGRHSGYIASTAVLAQQDVNFVLIPEIDFDIEGPEGFLAELEKRLRDRKHSVIVVAEGAGQKYFEGKDDEWDASGNLKLKDIGVYLKERIADHFNKKNIEISLKYIDPSYMIRSLPANANDSVFCGFLGRDAVHAGMAGKTKILIGHWNNHFVHVPMELSAGKRKNVTPDGKLWRTVLESTGQGHLKND